MFWSSSEEYPQNHLKHIKPEQPETTFEREIAVAIINIFFRKHISILCIMVFIASAIALPKTTKGISLTAVNPEGDWIGFYEKNHVIPEHILYKTNLPTDQFTVSEIAADEVSGKIVFQRMSAAAKKGEGDTTLKKYPTAVDVAANLIRSKQTSGGTAANQGKTSATFKVDELWFFCEETGILFSELSEDAEELYSCDPSRVCGIGETPAEGDWTRQLFLSMVFALDELAANLQTNIETTDLVYDQEDQNKLLEYQSRISARSNLASSVSLNQSFGLQSSVKVNRSKRNSSGVNQRTTEKTSQTIKLKLPETILGSQQVTIIRSFESLKKEKSRDKIRVGFRGMPDNIDAEQMRSLVKLLRKRNIAIRKVALSKKTNSRSVIVQLMHHPKTVNR